MPDKVVSLALPLKESACPGICILIKHACCRDGVLGEMLFHGQIIQGYPAGTRMRLQPGADLLRAAFACGDAADDALREMPGAKERLKSGQRINGAPGRGQDDLGVECAAQLREQRHRLCIDPEYSVHMPGSTRRRRRSSKRLASCFGVHSRPRGGSGRNTPSKSRKMTGLISAGAGWKAGT